MELNMTDVRIDNGLNSKKNSTGTEYRTNFFDPQYYANMNSDLLRAGLVKYSDLTAHWNSFGKKEGRTGHPSLHTKSYGARYPDLAAAFGTDNVALYNHYITHGQYEGRDGTESGLLTIRDNGVSISASARQAGAVDSLFIGGIESINSLDHGRQLQTCCLNVNFEGCYNPTQAGTRKDGLSASSTSKLLFSEITNNGKTLHTRTQCGFWVAPGEKLDDKGVFPCTRTATGSPLSNWIVDTAYTLSKHGLVTKVDYDMSWKVPFDGAMPPQAFMSEITTGYHTADFKLGFEIVPEDNYAARPRHMGNHLTEVGQERPYPVMLSTSSGDRAIGVWSPKVANINTLYATWLWNFGGNREAMDSSKWTIIHRHQNGVEAGQILPAKAVMFVGTLHEVHQAMIAHITANS